LDPTSADRPAGEKPRPGRRWYSADSIQYYTEEENEAFFRAVVKGGSVRDLAIFELAFHRGLRASEVGKLRVGDIRMSAGRTYIFVRRAKGGLSGEYVATDRESRVLRRWKLLRGSTREDEPIFPSRHRQPISRQRLDALNRQYGLAAGIPVEKLHFHCWRHTCGTTLIQFMDILDVKDHLGHKDVRSTMIYARITSRRRKEMGEKLRKIW
jgi:integrase/recombinase XerD